MREKSAKGWPELISLHLRQIYTRFQINTNIYAFFFLYSLAADRTNYRYNFSKVKYNSC